MFNSIRKFTASRLRRSIEGSWSSMIVLGRGTWRNVCRVGWGWLRQIGEGFLPEGCSRLLLRWELLCRCAARGSLSRLGSCRQTNSRCCCRVRGVIVGLFVCFVIQRYVFFQTATEKCIGCTKTATKKCMTISTCIPRFRMNRGMACYVDVDKGVFAVR